MDTNNDIPGGDKMRTHKISEALENAAPELLDACKAVLEHVENMDIARLGQYCTLCKTYRDILRAAIAKAEGGVL
jgi:hypothetical protein